MAKHRLYEYHQSRGQWRGADSSRGRSRPTRTRVRQMPSQRGKRAAATQGVGGDNPRGGSEMPWGGNASIKSPGATPAGEDDRSPGSRERQPTAPEHMKGNRSRPQRRHRVPSNGPEANATGGPSTALRDSSVAATHRAPATAVDSEDSAGNVASPPQPNSAPAVRSTAVSWRTRSVGSTDGVVKATASERAVAAVGDAASALTV